MATISTADTAAYLQKAGFSGQQVPIMVAIAQAESGLNPSATNPYDNGGTQTSWGLWQISFGNHQAPTNWQDPQTNANLAYAKFKSQGYSAWGSYTNGSYKKFLGNVSPGGTTGTGGTTSAALSSLPFGLGPAISGVQTTLVNAMEEIGIFMLALVVIVLGIFILNSDEIKNVSKKALSV